MLWADLYEHLQEHSDTKKLETTSRAPSLFSKKSWIQTQERCFFRFLSLLTLKIKSLFLAPVVSDTSWDLVTSIILMNYTFYYKWIILSDVYWTLIYGRWASPVAQLVKNPPAMWETWVRSLGWEDPLENGKSTLPTPVFWPGDCIVHGVAKSRTQLSDFRFTSLHLWKVP